MQNVLLEYTLDHAIADGILSDAEVITPPEQPKFPLGRLIITTNASEQLPLQAVNAALARHASGDWGVTKPVKLGVSEPESLRA